MTIVTCIHHHIFDVTFSEEVAIDDNDADFVQLIGFQAAQEEEVLVEFVFAFLENRFALAPELDEKVRARLAVDVGVPRDLQGRHAVLHLNLVPGELRLVGRIRVAIAGASFDVITKRRAAR